MYAVDLKRVGILLYVISFLSYIAYIDQQETVRFGEPERTPTSVAHGDGLSRSALELEAKLQQTVLNRDKRLYALEKETERFEQQALLLSVEEEEETEILAVVAAPPPPAETANTQALPAASWITHAQLQEYLAISNWPADLHWNFTNIVSCESGSYSHEHAEYIFNSTAIGDQGRAYGLGQVRIDVHPGKAQRYNLLDPLQNLNASWEVYVEAGGFGPWSCSAHYIGRK